MMPVQGTFDTAWACAGWPYLTSSEGWSTLVNKSDASSTPEAHPLSWRNLLEMLPDGIVIVDHDGRIRHVNHRLLALSGFGVGDLVGHEIEVLIPERLRPTHETDRAKYSERPTTREMNGPFSFVLARHDGSEISVDVALAPISVDGDDWSIAEVRSTDESVSEGARPYNIQQLGGAAMVSVAVALAQSEERFRLAFENNMAPMIFTDLEDRVFMANDAFCSLIE